MHRELAVLDLPGRAGVLPLHPGRAQALLEEPGLIHDQHALALTQMLHDVVPDVIAHAIDIPVRPPQQPLHTIRADLASVFSQRPAVLPFQTRDQT